MKLEEYNKCYRIREYADPKTGKKRRESIYVGPWFTTKPEALQRLKKLAWPVWGSAVAILIAAGFLASCRPLTSAWAAAGYLFCALPLICALPCVIRVGRMDAKFTLIDKEDTLRTLRNASAGLGLLAILWVLASLITLISGGFGASPASDLLFTLAGAAVSALGWALCRAADVPVHEMFDKAAFEKEEQA